MLPDLPVPEPAPVAVHVLEPERGEPVPAGEVIDLTPKPEPVPDIDLTPESEPVRGVRPESRWQAVPPRGASSPLDGTLNDMVEELHRKAREDVGDPRPR